MKASFDLTGKVAIVTGAYRGLGRGMAIGLAEAGADIVLVDREEAKETADVVRSLGRKVLTLSADLMSIDPIPSLVQQAIEMFGKVDILINNAGTIIVHPHSITRRKTGMTSWLSTPRRCSSSVRRSPRYDEAQIGQDYQHRIVVELPRGHPCSCLFGEQGSCCSGDEGPRE